MRSETLVAAIILIAAVMLMCGSSLWAEENPLAPSLDVDVAKPQAVCTPTAPAPVCVSASSFELQGSKIFAKGGMRIQKGTQRFLADEAEYDLDAETGTARNVFFTTCTCERPDYHITAGSLMIRPNDKLVARNVSVYLGRTKLLTLPRMMLRMGGRSSTSSIFPRVGNDSRDGITLRQALRLIDTNQARSTLDLKLTQKHSLQASVNARYGVGGRLVDFPGRYVTYGTRRSRELNVPQPIADDCDPQLLRPTNAARLQPFGLFTMRQRTYDANDPGLVVYRQPELGVSYLGSQLSFTRHKLDPRLELYPQITASWGLYKETPGQNTSLSRTQVVMQGAVNTLWLGPRTTIQPLGIASYADYPEGQSFRTWGWGIDAAHLARNDAYYSARYISRTSSGKTPFQFDNVDIKRELDITAQTYLHRHVFGLALNYDVSDMSLYDWEALYGQRTDCLGMYIRWNNRFRHLSFDIGLINL